MSDNDSVGDKRFDYIKERIGAAFPKLNGPKFDKQISTDEIRYQQRIFYCFETSKCSDSRLQPLWLDLTIRMIT